MASTSTNKQPLLVDRVFNNLVTTNTLASGSATSIDILGTNASTVLVDCTTNDGGIVEDMWTIARSTVAYKAMFYLSTAVDYLRDTEAVYTGEITSATTVGSYAGSSSNLPFVLAPVPQVGNESKNRAFYVPTGKALWVTLQLASPVGNNTTPIVGVQGGFY